MVVVFHSVKRAYVSIPRRELEKLSGPGEKEALLRMIRFHSPEGIREAVCRTGACHPGRASVVSIPRRELEKLSAEVGLSAETQDVLFPFPGGN